MSQSAQSIRTAPQESPGEGETVDLSVIIPLFNEQALARSIVGEVSLVLERMARPFEIILVNDGSTDDTADALATLESRHVRIKTHPYNIGNGAAIKSGIRMARGKCILMMDGDGQHDPEDIARLFEFGDQYDMVVGQRTRRSETSLHRDLANGVFNLFASWVCGRPIRDLTSGLRLVRTEVVLGMLDLLPNTFSYPTTLTLAVLRSGYSLKYVPIVVRRRTGRSKIGIFTDGMRFFAILLRISVFFAPLKVFTPLSLFFFLPGFGWYAYHVWGRGEPFPPVSILLMLSALFIFLIGLLSEQITYLRHERR